MQALWNEYQSYLILALIAAVFIWRSFRFRKVKTQMPILFQSGAIVVDVRTPSEFQQGARPGSLNIPLNELNSRCKELNPQKPVILCCASGTRSAMAVGILKKNGFQNVVNAGPWTNTLAGGPE